MEKETFLDRIISWFKNNKFFSIIIFLAILIIAVANVFDSITSIFEKKDKYLTSTSDPPGFAKKTDTSFANVALTFGGKGIGPGLFNKNAWLITTDKNGRVYVGEREDGGRIQVFDSTGKFILQWKTTEKTSLFMGLTNDRNGNIYAANGSIYRYESETGKLLGRVYYEDPVTDVKTKSNGGLIAGSYKDLIFFDSRGKIIRTIHEAILSHPDVDNMSDLQDDDCDHLAVDGLENIYVIEHYGNAVFKFSPDGKFANRFATGCTAMAIAIDGKGRVYISCQGDGIKVFKSDGSYITTFNADNEHGVAMSMAFNDKNELYVLAAVDLGNDENRVIKYILNDNFQVK